LATVASKLSAGVVRRPLKRTPLVAKNVRTVDGMFMLHLLKQLSDPLSVIEEKYMV
jgi:hypothetical protein